MGGGINLELLARLKSLEDQVSGLQQELSEVKASRGGNDYGLVKLSSSQSITNSVGLALPASENNAGISGTLANRIANNRNALAKKQQFYTSLESIGITSTFIPDILAAMPSNSKFIAILNVTGISTNPNNKAPINVGIIEIEKAGGYSKTVLIQTDSGKSTGVLYQASVDTVNRIVRGWYKFSGTYIE